MLNLHSLLFLSPYIPKGKKVAVAKSLINIKADFAKNAASSGKSNLQLPIYEVATTN